MFRKELIQIARDPLTLAMLILMPLLQVVLFGYAISTVPKNLSVAFLSGEPGQFSRTLATALRNSDYFSFRSDVHTEEAADKLQRRGEANFIVTIPTDFTRQLIRQKNPKILVQVDGSNPSAVGSPLAILERLLSENAMKMIEKANPQTITKERLIPASLVTHVRYNSELLSEFFIVPALIGTVLTMTMIIITSVAITKEYEGGTMENLLATPLEPIEVILGKVLPYVTIGYVQILVILFSAGLLFHLPFQGSFLLLMIATLPFIIANLGVGVTFSTFARNQHQAIQMAIFFFLPSILLSGFLFSFDSMPKWAQGIGSVLPLTYFNRIVRGILLRGNNFADIWGNLWPIIIFMVAVIFIASRRYRRTLD